MTRNVKQIIAEITLYGKVEISFRGTWYVQALGYYAYANELERALENVLHRLNTELGESFVLSLNADE